VAAVVVWGLSLPPKRAALERAWDDGSVRSVLHVHSRASDGRGTLDDIAAAAAAAGVKFVVVTDHGDGTRKTEPPSYRSGVLLVEGVEISTRGGHYVAVGMPRSPYPLGGEAADVVDDVRRLGGFGIAAHPDSPKPELRWSDWTAPVDAVELLNLDTSWRVHAFGGGAVSKWLLLRSLLGYPVRGGEAIAQLLTASPALRERWLAMADQRPVVALAGADAHAKLALRDTEPGDNSFSVPIPDYESSFEALSVHLRPARPLTGDAAVDAELLVDALRAGRSYVSIDGWASPPAFEFTASNAAVTVREGDRIDAGSPVTLHVRSNAPGGYATQVWRGSQLLTERSEREIDIDAGAEPGVYTVQVVRPNGAGLPAWITSNPIYVGRGAHRAISSSEPAQGPAPLVAAAGGALFDGQTLTGWSYEADANSLAVVDVAPLVAGNRIRLRYGLAGGAAVGQYAAAAVATPRGVDAANGVAFVVRAEEPMRISVQVRAEVAGSAPERWERSVYVDATDAERVVRFDQMKPVGVTHTQTPPPAGVRAIMFVVDTTNSKPGTSGRLWLGDVRLTANAR
jgi:hypothetical protein